MLYRARVIKPRESDWYEAEADTAPKAADRFIDDHEFIDHFTYVHDVDGGRETVTFHLVEIAGYGEFMVRRYRRGIGRRGGIKLYSGESVLKKIADGLGYDGEPKELLEPGWDLEEDDWH